MSFIVLLRKCDCAEVCSLPSGLESDKRKRVTLKADGKLTLLVNLRGCWHEKLTLVYPFQLAHLRATDLPSFCRPSRATRPGLTRCRPIAAPKLYIYIYVCVYIYIYIYIYYRCNLLIFLVASTLSRPQLTPSTPSSSCYAVSAFAVNAAARQRIRQLSLSPESRTHHAIQVGSCFLGQLQNQRATHDRYHSMLGCVHPLLNNIMFILFSYCLRFACLCLDVHTWRSWPDSGRPFTSWRYSARDWRHINQGKRTTQQGPQHKRCYSRLDTDYCMKLYDALVNTDVNTNRSSVALKWVS